MDGGTYLAVGSAVVVDVRSGSEPELCAVLPARVHHREVVLPVHQDAPLLILQKRSDNIEHQLD